MKYNDGQTVDSSLCLGMDSSIWLASAYWNGERRLSLCFTLWKFTVLTTTKATFIYWKEIGKMMNLQDLWETRLDMVHWLEVTLFPNYQVYYGIPTSLFWQAFEKTLAPSKEANELVNAGFEYFLQRVPRQFGIPELTRNIFLSLVGENTRRIAMWVVTISLFLKSSYQIISTYIGFLIHLGFLGISCNVSWKSGNFISDISAFHGVCRNPSYN